VVKKSIFSFVVYSVLGLLFLGCIENKRAFAASTSEDKNGETTKHIHFPFVHIDVQKHKDGTKDVDVKAPFTRVHNPAGPNNADVKAPFYKVTHSENKNVADKKSQLPPKHNSNDSSKP
jgi:hypothetical protein